MRPIPAIAFEKAIYNMFRVRVLVVNGDDGGELRSGQAPL